MDPNDTRQSERETIEIDLLLEAVFRSCGYDFRSYARASIERRIRQFLSKSGCTSVSGMIPKVLHDKEFASSLIRYFSVSVTEMFRDPAVYLAVREIVVPLLRTWPHIKVWHAGCASGEEVYSLAIVLKEEGLYDRATIYATDFNDEILEHAREGIFETEKLREATRNYQLAGGKRSFSEYYHAQYDVAAMDASLRKRVVFSSHNLATDSVFGEMHLIFCRNVLIYFNRDLQNRALKLFSESLVHGGFLCLGTKESLRFTDVGNRYEIVDEKARIYKIKAFP
jgi:chemotaxis protein methyltransferase CheR